MKAMEKLNDEYENYKNEFKYVTCDNVNARGIFRL